MDSYTLTGYGLHVVNNRLPRREERGPELDPAQRKATNMRFTAITRNGSSAHNLSFSSGKMFVDDFNHGNCPAVPLINGLRIILPNGYTWVWRDSDNRVEQFPNYVPDSTCELFTTGHEDRIDECLSVQGVGAGVMARIEAKTAEVWQTL